MRVIGNFSDASLAHQFAAFLIRKGIENHIEVVDEVSYIWVENEDELEAARAFFLAFEAGEAVPIPPPPPKLKVLKRVDRGQKIPLHHVAFVTKLVIFLCIVIFGLSGLEQVAQKTELTTIRKWLLFEIPMHHPYWEGIYDQLASHRFWGAPLFVQIREGEIWRLITPVFLHADFLHIAFNMLWLWSLGKEVEKRLGIFRYIVLMLIAALISNVAQYLMSGPFFMGYSGVIAGLAGFIYIRQKEAPWEGYPIHPSTFLFLAIFIFGLAALQSISFFASFFGWGQFNVSIGNTAHIVGAFTGMALAKLRWFK